MSKLCIDFQSDITQRDIMISYKVTNLDEEVLDLLIILRVLLEHLRFELLAYRINELIIHKFAVDESSVAPNFSVLC